MKILRLATLGLLCTLGASATAQAGWSVGIGIGGPCYGRPWGYGYHGYYAPYYYRPAVYVAPPPVIVQPAVVQPAPVIVTSPPPTIVQPAPVAQPAYQANSLPPAPVPVGAVPANYSGPVPTEDLNAAVTRHLQSLNDPDERVRSDAVLQLGRLRADRAVDPLAATLAGDRSPLVRDTAARALGMIGSTRGLPTLTNAAQTDSDRDVRRSAQFAVEIIQGR